MEQQQSMTETDIIMNKLKIIKYGHNDYKIFCGDIEVTGYYDVQIRNLLNKKEIGTVVIRLNDFELEVINNIFKRNE